MKIVYIGAGSHFFESVSLEIAQTPALNGATVTLYDPDTAAMELIRQVTQRISDHFGAGLRIEPALELAEALEGATAVISSIGVHGPGKKWHKLDVEAVAPLGIMQTTGDTVGPTGISQGLRIIPLYIELAREMEKYCPDCVLLNHSNPMAAICRAVSKFTKIRIIGYCHNVAGAVRTFGKVLGVDHAELDYQVAGVNHQTWLLSLRHCGEDVYPELKRRILQTPDGPVGAFTRELLSVLGLYLMGGDRHIVEFFPHSRLATKPSEIGYGMKWRAGMIAKNLLSEELTKSSVDLEARARGGKPLIIPEHMSPEAMGEQIRALTFGPDMVHVLNVPNNGTVTNVPPWAVMETKCVVGMHGAQPVYVGEIPAPAVRWTLAQIYAHELVVDAAAEGSREKAIQAIACDPMVRDFVEPEKILDALIEAQGDRMAPFRKATHG